MSARTWGFRTHAGTAPDAATGARATPICQLEDGGVPADLVRTSVGPEDVEDIRGDLDQAQASAAEETS